MNDSTKKPNAIKAGPDLHQPKIQAALKRYWASNVKIMMVLLAVWLLAGLGAGVLFADWLNRFNLPGTGYPLGFWFAQQGSIIVFVTLILVYCILMNRLDRRHHADLKRYQNKGQG